jgi:hypothetical protein
MAACGPDIVSVDGSVDLTDAVKRIGPGYAFQVGLPAHNATQIIASSRRSCYYLSRFAC